MVSGFVSSFASFAIGQIFKSSDGVPIYPFGLEPMFPGLIVSTLVYVVGKVLERVR